MKTSFLRQSKESRARVGRIPRAFAVIGLLVLIILGVNYATFGGLSRVLHTIGNPLWKAQARAGGAVDGVFAGFKDKQSLREENKRLKEEIVRLTFSSISAEVLRHENEDLRRLLQREGEVERIAAAVLARPSRSLYDTFVVDVGRKNGVVMNARVFGAGDIVIGTVAEVYPSTSLVSLYSTPGRTTEIFVGDDSAISAEAVGRGGGDFEVKLPRGVEVTAGTPVFSPLLQGGILGVVEDVVALPSNSFQTILFSSPVNIQSLRTVAVELQ
ncbi:rod shape-determining protein MreC [Candidatus Kaiserbacteria bacterium]|nr:rod shape-determining protein MreC [Candidatus Kaiserbacteria bacterium]